MNIETAKNWPHASDLGTGGWQHLASATEPLAIHVDGERLSLNAADGTPAGQARVTTTDGRLLVDDVTFAAERLNQPQILAGLVDAAFRLYPAIDRALLPSARTLWPVSALATETLPDEAERALVHRSVLRQLPLLWRRQASHVTYPELPTALGPQDRLPPLRPPRPCGPMYERWIAEIGMTLSFRPIDRRCDLDLFHRWMNDGRVAFFWELAQSREELDKYLADQESDPHIFGVIGSLDNEPVGYFEFYWAREDRLGPYYEPHDYDRGWHGLIGNARHLGRPKTLAFFRSITHYLFLDEPRTLRIVGEPRASHQKMLSYCADAAYNKVKEFDFPHKRAALVCCERERFFREVPL
ncbi:hypothetical protein ASD44_13840 [Mesorhizobium sp. Root554]|uniref:GNAT family N-acetyltransferase n=1 Tax=unclassified Mesorhizobium TaxID=325217 RepID=UPI0007009477|nr:MULTISPECIES: GNAT family N-acetyltransferase [unclassified Mesorhizobium]KQZ15018.1 hypothetical protein ASD27_13845 [Mesorhizobium sp. Root1471]KQZ37527.1 hypothetical protein ASD44_13840 [Mesorhizobium sp. Root554]